MPWRRAISFRSPAALWKSWRNASRPAGAVMMRTSLLFDHVPRVRDPTWEEDERPRFGLEARLSTSCPDRAFEDIHGFVLALMAVQGGSASRAGLDQGEGSARRLSPCLDTRVVGDRSAWGKRVRVHSKRQDSVE